MLGTVQGKPMKDIITWGPMDVGFISAGSGIAGLNNLNLITEFNLL